MLRDRHGSIDYCEEGAGPTIGLGAGIMGYWLAWRGVIAGAGRSFPDGNDESPGLW